MEVQEPDDGAHVAHEVLALVNKVLRKGTKGKELDQVEHRIRVQNNRIDKPKENVEWYK